MPGGDTRGGRDVRDDPKGEGRYLELCSLGEPREHLIYGTDRSGT